jgi:hypothetical protein
MPRIRIALLGLVVVAGAASATRAGEYVGAERCRDCHEAQYEAWRRSPHARAYAVLAGPQQNDPRCVQCHTLKTEEGLTGVQCESCHGPGRHYQAEHVMRDPELARLLWLVDPTEQTCARCHNDNSPAMAEWRHDAALEAIRHWQGDGRAAAEAAAKKKKGP